MSAVVFGSPEAAQIVRANKAAEARDIIDMDQIEALVEVSDCAGNEDADPFERYYAEIVIDGVHVTWGDMFEDTAIAGCIKNAFEYLATNWLDLTPRTRSLFTRKERRTPAIDNPVIGFAQEVQA